MIVKGDISEYDIIRKSIKKELQNNRSVLVICNSTRKINEMCKSYESKYVVVFFEEYEKLPNKYFLERYECILVYSMKTANKIKKVRKFDSIYNINKEKKEKENVFEDLETIVKNQIDFALERYNKYGVLPAQYYPIQDIKI